jgi:hypothetical protein
MSEIDDSKKVMLILAGWRQSEYNQEYPGGWWLSPTGRAWLSPIEPLVYTLKEAWQMYSERIPFDKL